MLNERDLTDINIEKTLQGSRMWYHPEGYFVKASPPGNLGVTIEILVSDIADKVGVSHIQYKRERIKHLSGEYTPVAISRDYRKVLSVSETITADRYVLSTGVTNPSYVDTYSALIRAGQGLRKKIDEMILFDCLINNQGRTLSNVYLVKDRNGVIDLAPLHGHDCALFCTETSQDLEDLVQDYDRYHKALARGEYDSSYFGHTHREGLDLVSTRPLEVMRLDTTMEEWRSLVNRYKPELGELRCAFIIDLLVKRQDLLYEYDQMLKSKMGG